MTIEIVDFPSHEQHGGSFQFAMLVITRGYLYVSALCCPRRRPTATPRTSCQAQAALNSLGFGLRKTCAKKAWYMKCTMIYDDNYLRSWNFNALVWLLVSLVLVLSGIFSHSYWTWPLKSWVFPVKLVIFHSYVGLPEGTYMYILYLIFQNQSIAFGWNLTLARQVFVNFAVWEPNFV